jgi:hypothetical protein
MSMKKWFLYFATFLAVLFFSFWGYVWIYRVEFVQTAMERSCPPYKITIEAIEIQDSQTVSIQNLCILTKESSPKLLVRISKATLSSPATSWLFWLLTPSTASLHLNDVTLVLPQSEHLSFDHPALHLFLDIDTLTVEGPDGKLTTYHHLHSPFSDVLTHVHQRPGTSKLCLGGKTEN